MFEFDRYKTGAATTDSNLESDLVNEIDIINGSIDRLNNLVNRCEEQQKTVDAEIVNLSRRSQKMSETQVQATKMAHSLAKLIGANK